MRLRCKANGLQKRQNWREVIGRTKEQMLHHFRRSSNKIGRIICGHSCSAFIILPLLLRLRKDEGSGRGRKRRRQNVGDSIKQKVHDCHGAL